LCGLWVPVKERIRNKPRVRGWTHGKGAHQSKFQVYGEKVPKLVSLLPEFPGTVGEDLVETCLGRGQVAPPPNVRAT